MSKQFWLILLVIAAVLGGILVVTNHNKTNTGSGTPTSHIEGNPGKGVMLVEYGDYQCPACGEFYATAKEAAAKYSQSIGFQFREFPLTSLHQNAFSGARAAEAAGLQGKYFEMHDLLYEQNVAYYNSNQKLATWIGSSDPESYFDQYARQLGLNLAKFQQDYASEQVNNSINADMAAGNRLNIDSTPTFFLDGKRLDNHQLIDASGQPSTAALAKLIDAEIAQKNPTPKQ